MENIFEIKFLINKNSIKYTNSIYQKGRNSVNYIENYETLKI